jgi:hypothetical protein
MPNNYIQVEQLEGNNVVFTDFNSKSRPWRFHTTYIYHDPSLVTALSYTNIEDNPDYTAYNNQLNIEASGSNINFYTKDNYKTNFYSNVCVDRDLSLNGYLNISNDVLIGGDVTAMGIVDCSSIKSKKIYINNENDSTSEFDISYDTSFLTLSRGLKLGKEGLSCENIICDTIDVSSITSHVLFTDSMIVNGQQYTGSDDRYKHNEKNINNGLEIIRQLRPQLYNKTSTFKPINYRGELNEPYVLEAGLIAQEVYEINDLSYVVRKGNSTTPYYLKYDNIFVYGVAGLKELDSLVTNLSSEINLLKEENNMMKSMLNKLLLKVGENTI